MLPLLEKVMAEATKDDETPARMSIVQEFLSTERTYVDSLTTLVDAYGVALREKKAISQSDYATLFQNVESILSFHRIFYADLEERIKKWNRHSVLGDLFVRLCDFFKLYMQYINGFDASTDLLKHLLKKKSKFRDTHEAIKINKARSLDMASLLIMPVQRIPRYVLLLGDLVKKTDEAHPDLAKLQEALAKMRETAGYLNSQKMVAESRERMMELDQKLTHWPADAVGGQLLQPARLFLFETDQLFVTAADPHNDADERVQPLFSGRNNWVFVFSDVVVIASIAFRVVAVYPLASAGVVRPRFDDPAGGLASSGGLEAASSATRVGADLEAAIEEDLADDRLVPSIVLAAENMPTLRITGDDKLLAKVDGFVGKQLAECAAGETLTSLKELPQTPLCGAFVAPDKFVFVTLSGGAGGSGSKGDSLAKSVSVSKTIVISKAEADALREKKRKKKEAQAGDADEADATKGADADDGDDDNDNNDNNDDDVEAAADNNKDKNNGGDDDAAKKEGDNGDDAKTVKLVKVKKRRRRKGKGDTLKRDSSTPASGSEAPATRVHVWSLRERRELSSRAVQLPNECRGAVLTGSSLAVLGPWLVWLGQGTKASVLVTPLEPAADSDDGEKSDGASDAGARWVALGGTGDPPVEPAARTHHAAAAAADGKALFVYGGQAMNGELLDDLWQLALVDASASEPAGALEWECLVGTSSGSELAADSARPAARKAAAALVYDQRLQLFGGVGADDALLSDLWTYSAGAWTLEEPQSHLRPKARHSAAMTSYATFVVVHGGAMSVDALASEDSGVADAHASDLSDAWAFDSASKAWFVLGRNLLSRRRHIFVQLARGAASDADGDGTGVPDDESDAMLVLGGAAPAQSLPGRDVSAAFGALLQQMTLADSATSRSKMKGRFSRVFAASTSNAAAARKHKRKSMGSELAGKRSSASTAERSATVRPTNAAKSNRHQKPGRVTISEPTNFVNAVSVSHDFDWGDDAHKDFELQQVSRQKIERKKKKKKRKEKKKEFFFVVLSLL